MLKQKLVCNCCFCKRSTLLAGCTAQALIPCAKNAAPQSQAFNFPKASCGDKPTGGNDTWYPVFVDGGSLETIHRNFCADTITTVRKDSKVQIIQVASFTNRDRTIEFVKAVGGNVGQLTDVGSSERQPQAAAGSDAVSSFRRYRLDSWGFRQRQ